MSKQAKNTVVVACPERGAANDPKYLELAFHQGPALINAHCQSATNLVDRD